MSETQAYEIHVATGGPNIAEGIAFAGATQGKKSDASPLDDRAFWKRFPLLRPQWLGYDTSRCVAAINPYPGEEFTRLMDGGETRGERLVIVSSIPLRASYEPAIRSGSWAVGGRALPHGVKASVTSRADALEKDLAQRLGVDDAIPWMALSPLQSGFELLPILVDDIGNVLMGRVEMTDPSISWFILPPRCDWYQVVRWIQDRAIPELVPEASRRVGLRAHIPDAFRTAGEREAIRNLAEFESVVSARRQSLEAAIAIEEAEANVVRMPLLEARGNELKRAVADVLVRAGFFVEDLDETMDDGVSADLLLTLSGKHWLIEVTSSARDPKHSEVSNLRTHLKRWPHMRKDIAIEHGVLVISNRLADSLNQRPDGPYADAAFVASLDVAVVSTKLIYLWWCAGAINRIRSAITDPPGQRS